MPPLLAGSLSRIQSSQLTPLNLFVFADGLRPGFPTGVPTEPRIIIFRRRLGGWLSKPRCPAPTTPRSVH